MATLGLGLHYVTDLSVGAIFAMVVMALVIQRPDLALRRRNLAWGSAAIIAWGILILAGRGLLESSHILSVLVHLGSVVWASLGTSTQCSGTRTARNSRPKTQ